MQSELLAEIRSLKAAIATLIGTSDLSPKEQFSKETLDKAAKQFQKLSIERGDWISDDNIDKFIKKAPYRSGAFIIKEFQFSNYFKTGYNYYFNKNDLIELSNELKKRNIDLKRYMEMVGDQAKFQKLIQSAAVNKNASKKKQAFQIPKGINNITTSPIPKPSADIIKADIKRLKDEFFEHKLVEYIDIYQGTHAMMKFIYTFDKYMEPELKRRAKRWCDDFNYANHALEEVTKKKETFVPFQDDDIIQL